MVEEGEEEEERMKRRTYRNPKELLLHCAPTTINAAALRYLLQHRQFKHQPKKNTKISTYTDHQSEKKQYEKFNKATYEKGDGVPDRWRSGSEERDNGEEEESGGGEGRDGRGGQGEVVPAGLAVKEVVVAPPGKCCHWSEAAAEVRRMAGGGGGGRPAAVGRRGVGGRARTWCFQQINSWVNSENKSNMIYPIYHEY